MKNLFESSEFWLLVLDTVVSLVLYFWKGEDVKFIIAALQPVFIMVIYGLTQIEKAAIAHGVHPRYR